MAEPVKTCECGCGISIPPLTKRGTPRRFLDQAHGLRHTATKPGLHGIPGYGAWLTAKGRCFTPSNKKYPNYGGRGITMCARYRDDFTAWRNDLGEKPAAGMTVDRVNNEGGYWCGNCAECRENGQPFNLRWATPTQQANNRRQRTRKGRTPCLVPGCAKPTNRSGICQTHYTRAARDAQRWHG